VVKVVTTNYAFAALKEGGRVVTWGAAWAGVDSSGVVGALRDGVVDVVATNNAFAALKESGWVVKWGPVVGWRRC